MMKLTSFFLVIIATMLVSSMLVSSSSPDSPLCVIPSKANPAQNVNLTTIAESSYPAQLATTLGLRNVQVSMGWCKPLNSTTSKKCGNQSASFNMIITDVATGSCVAGFSALTGPGLAVTNSSYSITEWSADAGLQANVMITCDTALPAGTAKLVGVITNQPAYLFGLQFNSSAACASSSSSFFNGLRHHH